MKNLNLVAIRKIIEVAYRVLLRMRFSNALFHSLQVMKTNIFIDISSSLNILDHRHKRLKKKFYDIYTIIMV